MKTISYQEKLKIEVLGINSTNGLVCKTGKVNSYRMAFFQGRGGSKKEATWNRKNNRHDCCKSACSWRHLRNCPKLKFRDEKEENSMVHQTTPRPSAFQGKREKTYKDYLKEAKQREPELYKIFPLNPHKQFFREG